MQLFIGNTTQQVQEIWYRLPENKKALMQRITPGGQIRISGNRGNLSQHDVDAIFDQQRKYGLIRVEEVGKVRGHCGLVASIDKPVNFDRLIAQVRRNREVLVERGKEIRTAAAVALNEAIETNLSELGGTDVLREVEFSVEEQKRTLPRINSRADEELARELSDAPRVAEGVRVTREVQPGQPRTPLRRRRGAGRS